MSNKLKVKVTSKKTASGEVWEGMASITGFKPTKITRNDGTTQFTNRAAVNTAARNRAKQLGYSDVDFGTESVKPVAKKAAKKSAGSMVKTSTTTVMPSTSY